MIHVIAGTTPSGQFGYEVSELGDIDGDKVADFLIGEVAGHGQAKNAGRVVAYSGADATPLFELLGESSADNFGNAAAAVRSAMESFCWRSEPKTRVRRTEGRSTSMRWRAPRQKTMPRQASTRR